MKSSILRPLGIATLLVSAVPLTAALAPPGPTAHPTNLALAVPPSQEATPEVPERELPLPPTADFTRADYEAALAKWRSQGATKYEMVMRTNVYAHLNGTRRLTVESQGGVDRVIDFEPVGFAEPVSNLEELNPMTIAGIFNQIDHALKDVEKAGGDGSFQFTPDAYSATFHPVLGYPISFTNVPSQPTPDAEFFVEVQSVTILQRAPVPGMPRTGHPQR